MFGLGFSEILIVLCIALIVVGPDQIPELARKLGRMIWQVKHTAEEFRKEVGLSELDFHGDFKEELKELEELHKSDSDMDPVTKPDDS
jgi:sec-independent protein translocase protein TatB